MSIILKEGRGTLFSLQKIMKKYQLDVKGQPLHAGDIVFWESNNAKQQGLYVVKEVPQKRSDCFNLRRLTPDGELVKEASGVFTYYPDLNDGYLEITPTPISDSVVQYFRDMAKHSFCEMARFHKSAGKNHCITKKCYAEYLRWTKVMRRLSAQRCA